MWGNPSPVNLNWDQTRIKFAPSSQWTMTQQGSRKVEVVGLEDKWLFTTILCGFLVGDFLPMQLVCKGKHHGAVPKFSFPMDWNITHSPRHWSTESTVVEHIQEIIIPYVDSERELFGEDEPALVIMDNFKGQTPSKITELLDQKQHSCFTSAS